MMSKHTALMLNVMTVSQGRTRAEISAAVHCSLSTLSRVMDELSSLGVVFDCDSLLNRYNVIDAGIFDLNRLRRLMRTG